MACFERQGRVSSGEGAERRGRRTWVLPSATRHRLEDCRTLNWPEALAPRSVRCPKIAFDSLQETKFRTQTQFKTVSSVRSNQ